MEGEKEEKRKKKLKESLECLSVYLAGETPPFPPF